MDRRMGHDSSTVDILDQVAISRLSMRICNTPLSFSRLFRYPMRAFSCTSLVSLRPGSSEENRQELRKPQYANAIKKFRHLKVMGATTQLLAPGHRMTAPPRDLLSRLGPLLEENNLRCACVCTSQLGMISVAANTVLPPSMRPPGAVTSHLQTFPLVPNRTTSV